MAEKRLMKGNEVLAEAAIRCGCDGYFGYPITPQSEVMETLMARQPWTETGMVVLQAESEVAAINMVYGAAGSGKKAMTSSSSPGISLMSEGISYIAGAELPCLIVNVQRGGPGLGTIQPSQADYFQAIKGGGHGDYKMIVLAPSSVQEMNDFVDLGFELAFKYRNPAMILSDGALGQMMEKVELSDFKSRWTKEEINEKWGSWATTGKPSSRKKNIVTSLVMDSDVMEKNNLRFQEKYRTIEEKEVRYETIRCEDAEFILVAFGTSSRVCQKAVEIARAKGLKVGLLRPITLFPFPKVIIKELARKVKGFMSVEMSAGQMVEDIKLSVYEAGSNVRVNYFGRMGGIIPTPEEVVEALEEKFSWELSYGVKDLIKPENLVYDKSKIQEDVYMHYCPGCSHGVVHKILAELIEEMGIQEKTVGVAPVGCAVFAYNYIDIDWQEAAHGRAPAVATGISRLYPENFVFTYQGDGDLASIGTAEIMHACNRGENILVVFINNGIYGMTGGQMAPTTLEGMVTSTTPMGRNVDLNGYPMRITNLIAQLPGTSYVTRQAVHTPAAVRKCKRSLKKAVENVLAKKGTSFVEVVSTCNSGWKMSPVAANNWMEANMIPFYPLGDLKDSVKGEPVSKN